MAVGNILECANVANCSNFNLEKFFTTTVLEFPQLSNSSIILIIKIISYINIYSWLDIHAVPLFILWKHFMFYISQVKIKLIIIWLPYVEEWK